MDVLPENLRPSWSYSDCSTCRCSVRGPQPATKVGNARYPRNTTLASYACAKCHPSTLRINHWLNLQEYHKPPDMIGVMGG